MVEAGRCLGCGSEIQAADRHCRSCGIELSEGLLVLRYKLSPKRVVVMSILSFGIYLWYWFYMTWKQYRDHTGERAYPVWHAFGPQRAHLRALSDPRPHALLQGAYGQRRRPDDNSSGMDGVRSGYRIPTCIRRIYPGALRDDRGGRRCCDADVYHECIRCSGAAHAVTR